MSWAGVAADLSKRGVEAHVPDLRHAAESVGTIDAVVGAAAKELPRRPQVLVGHSGAGVLLPLIAQVLGEGVDGFVFVDAHLPPIEGRQPLAGAGFERFLAGLATDDRLPKWSTWWGKDAIEAMVPDELLRAKLDLDMPRLPLAYFRQELNAVPGWTSRPCGYVRLSELYEPHAAAAEASGWPVERLSAGHLHAAVDPVAVTARILDVIGSTRPPRDRSRSIEIADLIGLLTPREGGSVGPRRI